MTLYCLQYKCSVSLSEVCAAEFSHTYLLCLSLLSVTDVCVTLKTEPFIIKRQSRPESVAISVGYNYGSLQVSEKNWYV